MGKKWIILLFLGFLVFVFAALFFLGYFESRGAGISIESVPPARVFINGVEVGRTPYEEVRKPEEISIRLIPDSFEKPLVPYETKVVLVPKVKTIIKRYFADTEEASSGIVVSFEKQTSKKTSVLVVSDPDTGEVYFDGELRGFTPYKINSVLPGDHELGVSLEGYEPINVKIRAYQGYTLTAVFKLRKIAEKEEKSSLEKEGEEELAKKVQILTTPTGFLRVRKEPSVLSEEIAQVKPGETYDFLEKDEKTGWFKIKVGEGKEGWISNQYSKIIEQSQTLSSPSPSP